MDGTSSRAILVAEDQYLLALDLEASLEEHDYRVCGIAATADEAVELAMRCRPALALVDVHLAEGSNGLEAVSTLRQRLGIPSIVVSGHAGKAEIEAAGAVGWMPKPVDHRRLIQLIAEVMTRHRALQRLA